MFEVGSANLVRDLKDDKIYVAKKIQLGPLGEKEQENALQEAKLLRNLNHPNIVKYINSFIDCGMLIIIQEYCEGNISIIKSHFTINMIYGLSLNIRKYFYCINNLIRG